MGGLKPQNPKPLPIRKLQTSRKGPEAPSPPQPPEPHRHPTFGAAFSTLSASARHSCRSFLGLEALFRGWLGAQDLGFRVFVGSGLCLSHLRLAVDASGVGKSRLENAMNADGQIPCKGNRIDNSMPSSHQVLLTLVWFKALPHTLDQGVRARRHTATLRLLTR